MQLIASPMRVCNVCVLVILGACVGSSRNPTNGSSNNDELLKSGLEKLDAEQYKKAIEIFAQLAEQSPTATHHTLIGDCYWKQRKLEAADIHYRKALDLDPKHCGANHALGRDAMLLRRFQDAVPYLDAANDLCAGTILHAQNLRFRVEAILELDRITEAEA